MTPNYFMTFANNSSAALYIMELKGQISDGKYENVRPYDHWKWVCTDFNYCVAAEGEIPCGYYPYRKYNNYNLREWPGYITRANSKYATDTDKDYAWAERVLFYGGFAEILGDIDLNEMNKQSGPLESLVESLGWYLKENGNENFTYEAFVEDLKKNTEWRVAYIEKASLFTKENVEKYAASFGTYTINELKRDLKFLKQTLHNEVRTF